MTADPTPRCKCCKCCLTTEQAVSQPQMQNHDSSDAKAPHRTNVFGPVGVSSLLCARVPVRVSTRGIVAPKGLRADALTHAREGRLVTDGGRDRDVVEPPHIETTGSFALDVYLDSPYQPDEDGSAERMEKIDGGWGSARFEAAFRDGRLVVTVGWMNGYLGADAVYTTRDSSEIGREEIPLHAEDVNDERRLYLADDERYEFAVELRKRSAGAAEHDGVVAESGGESA